jgi:uncharacterized protein YciI
MFVVELAFTDEQERLVERVAHRDRLQRLRANGTLVMAGPFADDSGALLVFDLPDESALEQVMDDDPYYRTPGVRVVGRREWSPIVGVKTTT